MQGLVAGARRRRRDDPLGIRGQRRLDATENLLKGQVLLGVVNDLEDLVAGRNEGLGIAPLGRGVGTARGSRLGVEPPLESGTQGSGPIAILLPKRHAVSDYGHSAPGPQEALGIVEQRRESMKWSAWAIVIALNPWAPISEHTLGRSASEPRSQTTFERRSASVVRRATASMSASGSKPIVTRVRRASGRVSRPVPHPRSSTMSPKPSRAEPLHDCLDDHVGIAAAVLRILLGRLAAKGSDSASMLRLEDMRRAIQLRRRPRPSPCTSGSLIG